MFIIERYFVVSKYLVENCKIILRMVNIWMRNGKEKYNDT